VSAALSAPHAADDGLAADVAEDLEVLGIVEQILHVPLGRDEVGRVLGESEVGEGREEL